MANIQPQVIQNFEAYLDGNRLLGIVDATLPNLQAMTIETQGSGLGGQHEVPILGHFQNMSVSFSWRVVHAEIRNLLPQKYHHIELWGAVQKVDPATGQFQSIQQKIIMRAAPVNFNLGTFAVGALQDTETEFNVSYIKIMEGSDEIAEIDFYNQIYKVGGQDLLSELKGVLGL